MVFAISHCMQAAKSGGLALAVAGMLVVMREDVGDAHDRGSLDRA
jgi:hypothetical protein